MTHCHACQSPVFVTENITSSYCTFFTVNVKYQFLQHIVAQPLQHLLCWQPIGFKCKLNVGNVPEIYRFAVLTGHIRVSG